MRCRGELRSEATETAVQLAMPVRWDAVRWTRIEAAKVLRAVSGTAASGYAAIETVRVAGQAD